MQRDITKQDAAIKLVDEIFGLQIACKKATFIMQEVCEEYFDKFNDPMGSDQWKLAWEYERYSSMCNAVFDYIVTMRDAIKELVVLSKSEDQILSNS